jgi:hypothetical protein
MTRTRPPISVFPKCYFDALCRGELDDVAWVRSAAAEHYGHSYLFG